MDPPFLVSLGTFNLVQYNYNSPHKFTFADINGDNLPDFLYHDIYNSSNHGYYAVYYNNGTSNFNLAYKCVFNSTSFYGDCGGTPWDPNAPANQNKLCQVLLMTQYYTGSSSDPYPPDNHIWLDINGDGLQDFIDDCLNINAGDGISFSRLCSWTIFATGIGGDQCKWGAANKTA